MVRSLSGLSVNRSPQDPVTSRLLHDMAAKYKKPLPELQPGYTVRVHEKIKEGEKERTQIFEGLVIAIHRGHVPTEHGRHPSH